MRLCAMLVLAGCLLTPTSASPQNAAAKEQEKLQGTWQVLRQEYDGNDENTQEAKWVIAPDKITIKEKQGERTATYTLDPAAQPKTIDLMLEVNGKTIHLTGIYQLDGETLRICASEKGQARPTEFVSAKGSRLTLVVLRRVKT
jgi:uncharacterized protein (TIGR03067 family)